MYASTSESFCAFQASCVTILLLPCRTERQPVALKAALLTVRFAVARAT
jgi:hypothetical protein